jgi:hypothetical protein
MDQGVKPKVRCKLQEEGSVVAYSEIVVDRKELM